MANENIVWFSQFTNATRNSFEFRAVYDSVILWLMDNVSSMNDRTRTWVISYAPQYARSLPEPYVGFSSEDDLVLFKLNFWN